MTTEPTVTITDVALRDGLQNHPRTLATSTKLALLDRLLAAGLRSAEIGSFVHPQLVPQMADTDEVVRLAPRSAAVDAMVLVPNQRGAARALTAGADSLRLLLSCSEGHSRSNTNRSVDEGLAETGLILEQVRAHHPGVRTAAAVATVFVCPFDGMVPMAQVEHVVDELVTMGLEHISLSDTLGRADPAHVGITVAAMRRRHPAVDFGLHLHNTYGMGLAGVVAGLENGVTQFDAALGGIGGCPFAPGAAGNVATEDVVFMLEAMGVRTGVSLELLGEATRSLSAALGDGLESSVSRALGWVA